MDQEGGCLAERAHGESGRCTASHLEREGEGAGEVKQSPLAPSRKQRTCGNAAWGWGTCVRRCCTRTPMHGALPAHPCTVLCVPPVSHCRGRPARIGGSDTRAQGAHRGQTREGQRRRPRSVGEMRASEAGALVPGPQSGSCCQLVAADSESSRFSFLESSARLDFLCRHWQKRSDSPAATVDHPSQRCSDSQSRHSPPDRQPGAEPREALRLMLCGPGEMARPLCSLAASVSASG